MPPLPKKKHTRARKGGRAAHHALRAPGLAMCPQCNSAKLPHRVCPVCGYYNGRPVIKTAVEEAPAEAETPSAE